MSLHIPNIIVILGQRYTVFVQPAEHKLLNDDDPDSWDALGHTDRSKNRISLRGPDGLAEDKARETLLHEVLHAVIGTARIPPFGEEGGEKEEEFVSMLAPILMDTLRRNPDLVFALVEQDMSVTHGEVVRTDEHAD